MDEANFYNERLIQIELCASPKTGNPSEAYKEKIDGRRADAPTVPVPIANKYSAPAADHWKRQLAPEYCAELEYMLDHYVKETSNKTRHHMILPSFAAYVRHKPNRAELIRRFCETQKKDPSEIEGWDAKNTYFGLKQIREYFKANGLEHISMKALLNGGRRE